MDVCGPVTPMSMIVRSRIPDGSWIAGNSEATVVLRRFPLRTPSMNRITIVFHEMLHLWHPVKLRGSRRCVHSREFLAEEKLFPHWEQAQKFLRIS